MFLNFCLNLIRLILTSFKGYRHKFISIGLNTALYYYFYLTL